MTRWASATNETQAALPATYLVVLASFDFSSGVVRIHDGAGPLSFGGNTYQGIGQLGSVDIIEENIDTVARGLRCTLSGVDPAIVATAMTESYQGRSATFWLGMLSDSLQFVDTPEEIWSGRMDVMTVAYGQNTASISLQCEHRLRKEPLVSRYTDTDQRLAYAGDRFFDLMTKIPQFKASWGDKPNSYSDPIYPGGGDIPGWYGAP
jgi:hypothetical protein